MVVVDKLSCSIAGHRILNGISFEAPSGTCTAVLGTNGAGKSTLITCLNQIRRPESGTVTVDGVNLLNLGKKACARIAAYVAQKTFPAPATVFDTVLLGRHPFMGWTETEEDRSICEETICELGLTDLALRNVNELSGGEQQKVMLARALAQQPKLLLLDEPTSSMDLKNSHEMLAVVHETAKKRNITVLTVIHSVDLALRYCDRFIFLKDGELYSCGGEETVTGKTVSDVYGIAANVFEYEGRKYAAVA